MYSATDVSGTKDRKPRRSRATRGAAIVVRGTLGAESAPVEPFRRPLEGHETPRCEETRRVQRDKDSDCAELQIRHRRGQGALRDGES